jgi:SAM-dependent methyltransferase
MAENQYMRARTAWKRDVRSSVTKGRLSRRNLDRFCREMATVERTLVVHSRDVDHERYFQNAEVLSKPRDAAAEPFLDPYLDDLEAIATGSFPVILCTGLLEHVPDPQRLVDEFHRILAPGGRLILAASAVFPFHGGRHNFFHFTPGGLRYLFRDWTGFDVLSGSSAPFETVAILVQRIAMRCDVSPPLRPLLKLVYRVIPLLDRFVLRQRDAPPALGEGSRASFMPAALYAVVVK